MRILVADDHQLFRGAVRQLLGEVLSDAEVLEAGSLDQALTLMGEGQVDLLTIDLDMPGVESMDSIAALGEAFPDAKVVILSATEEREIILEALSAGVDGYIPKSLSAPEIIKAIKDVLDGRVFIPKALARKQAPARTTPSAPRSIGIENLTERQRHVLEELMKGQSSKEIGREFDLAEGTVKIHLRDLPRIGRSQSRRGHCESERRAVIAPSSFAQSPARHRKRWARKLEPTGLCSAPAASDRAPAGRGERTTPRTA